MSRVNCLLFFFTLEMIVMYFHASIASQVNQASLDFTLWSCLLASEVQNIRPSRQTLLFSATFPHGSQAVCCGTLFVECLLLSRPCRIRLPLLGLFVHAVMESMESTFDTFPMRTSKDHIPGLRCTQLIFGSTDRKTFPNSAMTSGRKVERSGICSLSVGKRLNPTKCCHVPFRLSSCVFFFLHHSNISSIS